MLCSRPALCRFYFNVKVAAALLLSLSLPRLFLRLPPSSSFSSPSGPRSLVSHAEKRRSRRRRKIPRGEWEEGGNFWPPLSVPTYPFLLLCVRWGANDRRCAAERFRRRCNDNYIDVLRLPPPPRAVIDVVDAKCPSSNPREFCHCGV